MIYEQDVTNQLKPEHKDVVENYINEVENKTANSYMLTIARDGESPSRTIIFYENAIDAAEAYNKYTDWGFARNFLTVHLYEPSGKINKKVLMRNQAGDCTFIRQDYIDIKDILLSYKDKIDKKVYNELCIKIMTVFAKDNWRFSPERFLQDLGLDYKLQS